MTARSIGNVNVAEGVAVVGDGIADAALVDLHVVYIIQQLETRRADQTNDFSAHLGGSEEVADVVGGDVQRLEVEVDLFLLGQLSAGEQRVVHRAQLYGVGQVVVVVYYNAAVTQCVGVDGNAGCANLLSRRDGLLQVVQILLLVGRVYERVVRIAVEAGNGNAGLLSSLAGRIQIADAPVPELYGLKAVVLCSLETVEPVQLGVKGVDASAFSQCHNKLPPNFLVSVVLLF